MPRHAVVRVSAKLAPAFGVERVRSAHACRLSGDANQEAAGRRRRAGRRSRARAPGRPPPMQPTRTGQQLDAQHAANVRVCAGSRAGTCHRAKPGRAHRLATAGCASRNSRSGRAERASPDQARPLLLEQRVRAGGRATWSHRSHVRRPSLRLTHRFVDSPWSAGPSPRQTHRLTGLIVARWARPARDHNDSRESPWPSRSGRCHRLRALPGRSAARSRSRRPGRRRARRRRRHR